MGYKTFSLKIDLKMSRLGKTLTVSFETISISLRENKKTMLLNSHKIFYSKQCQYQNLNEKTLFRNEVNKTCTDV